MCVYTCVCQDHVQLFNYISFKRTLNHNSFFNECLLFLYIIRNLKIVVIDIVFSCLVKPLGLQAVSNLYSSILSMVNFSVCLSLHFTVRIWLLHLRYYVHFLLGQVSMARTQLLETAKAVKKVENDCMTFQTTVIHVLRLSRFLPKTKSELF